MLRGLVYLFVAVAASLAVFFASGRMSYFDAEIRVLENPSNADIYPLENSLLMYFALAMLLQVATILFSFFAGSRLAGRRARAT